MSTIKQTDPEFYQILEKEITREETTLEECLEVAYNDIKDRKGRMVDGIFVKEE